MKKTTMKSQVLEVLISLGAKVNADGQYEMTKAQYDNLIDEIEANFDSSKVWQLTLCGNKKDETLKGVYDSSKKNRYAIIKIVANKKPKKAQVKNPKVPKGSKASETKKAQPVDGERTRKEKGNGYVVIYKMEGDKKEKVDNKMTTCAEIKAFIKDLHHQAEKLEMLQIYKMGTEYANNKNDIIKTRLSAWR